MTAEDFTTGPDAPTAFGDDPPAALFPTPLWLDRALLDLSWSLLGVFIFFHCHAPVLAAAAVKRLPGVFF